MAGGMATFNIQDGFCDALIRGYRLGFITDEEFRHLVQCETLEDVRLNLQETDYGTFLQDEPSPISPSTIRQKAIEKMVSEFNYVRSQAAMPLGKFMDYVTYDYMIDNVMLILKATLNNPNVSVEQLLDQVHPLGGFTESTLKVIRSFENTPKGYSDLYNIVLVDTPIGKYMQLFLSENDVGEVRATGQVRGLLEEMPTTKLENSLRKYYLEDFYRFCVNEIGGETGEVMSGLLKSRGDAIAINITLNSFNTPLGEPNMVDDRRALYPSVGWMYPEGFGKIAKVENEEQLAAALAPLKQYAKIFNESRQETRTIDDLFFAKEIMECELAFEGQFTYANFYAYVRLKEAEIRNLTWLSECVVQRSKSRILQHYTPIFSRDAEFRKRL